MIGRDIVREIDKPKNLSFNCMKRDKNNLPFDNSTNYSSYGFHMIRGMIFPMTS